MDIYSAPKNTIRTNSGLFINVFDTDPDTITIQDIAHGLSMIPRFGGHLDKFYSVAQHSVLCFRLSLIYGFEYALAALLHDGSEAYLLDMPTPIKNGLPDYKEVEGVFMDVLARKFGFEYPLNHILKAVDAQALDIEWYNMVNDETKNKKFQCWSPKKAKAEFLKMYKFIEETLEAQELLRKARINVLEDATV